MSEVVIPKTIIEKTAKSGKRYSQIEFQDGRKASCFEKEIQDKIANNFGNEVEVELVESNGFLNLRQFIGLKSGLVKTQTERLEKLESPTNEGRSKKDSSIIAQTLTKGVVEIVKEDLDRFKGKELKGIAADLYKIYKDLETQLTNDNGKNN